MKLLNVDGSVIIEADSITYDGSLQAWVVGNDAYTDQSLRYMLDTDPSIAFNLATAKLAKNLEINRWRAQANQTTFNHAGKVIACDALSRSDIDAVAGSVALNGAFPVGFPNAWKAVDNSYLALPDIEAFKALYGSMTLQGTINFGQSQTLKAALAAAATIDEVNAIAWA
jgi:hypothetical protein